MFPPFLDEPPSSALSADANSHNFSEMKDAVPKMKDKVTAELSKVKEKGQRVNEAVREVSASLGALHENARVAEEFIESTFAQVREDLERRQAQLLQDTEAVRHQKEKELRPEGRFGGCCL